MSHRSPSTARLGQIEASIAAAERRLRLQRLRAEQLRAEGHDSTEAEELVRTLEELIAVYRTVSAEILARL